MEAPPGLSPYDTRQPAVYGVVSTVLVIATIALCLRIYTRAVILRNLGMDDYAAILAYFMIFACAFAVTWNTRYGFGKHVYFLSPMQLQLYTRTFYVSIVFYNISLLVIKTTFLLQYYRVFAIPHMRKAFLVAMAVVGAWSLSQVLIAIFICAPIEAFWDKSIRGNCIPNYPYWYVNAGGNIITDMIVFVLPIPVIKGLSLPKTQKYILMFIFCIGFFTCAISFVRIKFLKLTEDVTWVNVESACWSVTELCSGLVCSCLPTLRPLAGRFVPSLSSKIIRSTRHTTHKHSQATTKSLIPPAIESVIRESDPEKAQRRPDPVPVRGETHFSEDSEITSESQDLYARTAYDLMNRDDSFVDSGTLLPIQRHESDPMAPPKTSTDSTTPLRPPPQAQLNTHIRAMQPRERMMNGGPIHVECDIVQTESQRRAPVRGNSQRSVSRR